MIVVSEENGSVAIASDGTLRENLDRTAVLDAIVSRFGERS